MPGDKESEVLKMLQPDLLTKDELIQRIQARYCRTENLGLMSKEGLVGLFRRVILPLPQRFYRANRRGKMLTSRRARAGLESKRKEEGCSSEGRVPRVSESGDRLKPPPDISKSRKIRISSDNKTAKDVLENPQMKDGRKLKAEERPNDPDDLSRRKIALKRPSDDEKSSPRNTPQTENKRQRTAIKWP